MNGTGLIVMNVVSASPTDTLKERLDKAMDGEDRRWRVVLGVHGELAF